MNQLELGDYLGILGFIIGVIGIVLTIRSKKRKKISYEKNDFNLINEKAINKTENLEVFHNKTKIKNLTISKIAIWNSGNQTIKKGDISETSQLMINLDENVSILEQKVLSTSHNDLKVSIKNKTKFPIIKFNYLEPNNGFLIQITHTGRNSDCLNISGKIIGGSKIKRVNDMSRNAEKRDHWTTKYIVLFFSIAILIVTNLNLRLEDFWDVLKDYSSIIYFLQFFAGLMIGIVFMQFFERKVPKPLLEKFSNDK